MPEKPVLQATLLINGPGGMSDRSRNNIALWLEGQAYKLRRNGKLYTDGRFRSQFSYLPALKKKKR